MIGEIIGTFMLVLIGCGVVHAAVLTNAQSGLWQVAIVWGIGIMLAIYAVGAVSGAHLNPAMTLALAVWGRHPRSRVLPYVVAQMLGAFVAAAVLSVVYRESLAAKEAEKGVRRGEPGSVVTAMCYGEFFPNPGGLAGGSERLSDEALTEHWTKLSEGTAFLTELVGTMVLGFVVFAVTDRRNAGRPLESLAPVFIGLTVAVLISLFAPLTQACFNPARDLGPRLWATLAGWGGAAWPAGTGWLTVYIVAPCLGGVLGAGLYEKILRPCLPAEERP